MSRSQAPWWKGRRGEWYVFVQLALFALLMFGPRTMLGWPEWFFPYTLLGSIGGGFLLFFGGLLVVAGLFRLGPNLSILPHPKEQARLVETGPYQFVRHPIYSGALCMAFGWAFWVYGWLSIVYAALLFVFFDLKSRREELWLQEKFTGYAAYRQRVRKLIPFIY